MIFFNAVEWVAEMAFWPIWQFRRRVGWFVVNHPRPCLVLVNIAWAFSRLLFGVALFELSFPLLLLAISVDRAGKALEAWVTSAGVAEDARTQAWDQGQAYTMAGNAADDANAVLGWLLLSFWAVYLFVKPA